MQLSNINKSAKFARIFGIGYCMNILRMKPLVVHLYLTRKCNLRCEYCHVLDPGKREMSEDEVKRAVDKLMDTTSYYMKHPIEFVRELF